MDNKSLLTSIDLLRELIEKFNASPSISSLVLISCLSGLFGVILGFFFQQWIVSRDKKNKNKREEKLLDYELLRLQDNAVIAIKTSSYLLDNFHKIDRSRILIPNNSLRVFYEKFFTDLADHLSIEKMESITVAYEMIAEMDKIIHYLEDTTNSNQDKMLYNYEYVMSLASCAYRQAENALSSSPSHWKKVSTDHRILASHLGCECKRLYSKRRINMPTY